MSKEPPPIWSKQYILDYSSKSLTGDKILLPASALEQLLAAYRPSTLLQHSSPYYDQYNSAAFSTSRQVESQFADAKDQLPYPLTFKVVNPVNGRTIYAGVREFSAAEDRVVLSEFVATALDISLKEVGQSVTIHAKQLSKGTFVKLRPLEAGYDPADWKALLEQHLRAHYTTLTNGEILTVKHGRGQSQEEFRFLVDGFKPEDDGICIVDTDLEVDIEALNEEQARDTLKKIAAKLNKPPNTDSSTGGQVDIFQAQQGQIVSGAYVDYDLNSWNRTSPLVLELDVDEEDETVDLLISPLSATQRAKPRLDEYLLADLECRPSKRIRLDPTNVILEHAEALYITVRAHSFPESTTKHYNLRIRHPDEETKEVIRQHNADEVLCKNCHQWVSKASLMLHENFCLRNNILCPHGCGRVFQRRSTEYQNHWHCQYDAAYGNTQQGFAKHNDIFHPADVLRCSACETRETFADYPSLAQHHVSNCSAKIILCRFCHLEVPQEGDPDIPSAEVLLSGMTQHELLDGARTTECHMCSKIVRLRDMDTHLKSHDLDRLSRPPPQPCRNVNCGRSLDTTSKNGDTRAGTRMGQGPGNDIALCNVCFGPLYVSMHDPENKALRRRIERRYLQQLLTGCGKSWCKNEYCKTGRTHLDLTTPGSTKDALPLVQSFVKTSTDQRSTPLHFCVDEASQRKRALAEMLAAENDTLHNGGYSFEWCIGALEAENGDLDSARQWLKNWAPKRSDQVHSYK